MVGPVVYAINNKDDGVTSWKSVQLILINPFSGDITMRTTKSQRARVNMAAILTESTRLVEDRYGNFKAFSPSGNEYRVKLNKTSWRLEYSVCGTWRRILSEYYGKTNDSHFRKIRDYIG